MAFTTITTNPGTGGATLGAETAGGMQHPTSCVVFGPTGSCSNLVGVNQPFPVSLGDGQKATYSSGIVGLVPASSATDVFELNNSAGSKTLKVVKLTISGMAGTAITVPVSLVKRTTVNSGGTSSTPDVEKHETSDSAGTGIVKAYTANPTLGTGTTNVVKAFYLHLPLTTTAAAPITQIYFGDGASEKGMTLAANESLCVYLNATTVSSGLLAIDVCWTEQS